MESKSQIAQAFIEGQPCVIGREAQIKLDDISLSRGHAEIRFVNGKLVLRDLGSTNGTFLHVNGQFVPVGETTVFPDQIVALGSGQYRIKALLAMIGVYVSYSEHIGLVIKFADPDQKTITIETDVDELVSAAISELYK